MMNNIQEEGAHSQDLANILKEIINQSLQNFRQERRAKIAGNTTLPPIHVQRRNGRILTTTLLLEEIISFNVPENYDLAHFKDIDDMLSKLENWTIESRLRETKMFDTYYTHASSRRTFRSITEVVNHILPIGYPKLPTKKRKNKGDQERKSKRSRKNLSHGSNSKITEDKKSINVDVRNVRILPESLFRVPAKKKRRKRRNKGQEGIAKNQKEIPLPNNGSKINEEKENKFEVGNVSPEILPSVLELKADIIAPENETLRDEEIDEILQDFIAKVISGENKENNHEAGNVVTDQTVAHDDWISSFFI